MSSADALLAPFRPVLLIRHSSRVAVRPSLRRPGRVRGGRDGRADGRSTARPTSGDGQQRPADRPRVPVRRLRQVVQQELASQGAPTHAHRRETVHVQVAGLSVEVRQVRRADPPLPQAHGIPSVPMSVLRARLLAQRSPLSTHETTRLNSEPPRPLQWPANRADSSSYEWVNQR